MVIIEPEGQERSHPEEHRLKWAAQRSSVMGKIITVAPGQRQVVVALYPPFCWIPFGGVVRRCISVSANVWRSRRAAGGHETSIFGHHVPAGW